MNKTDLIDEMSVSADISKAAAGKALSALLEMIGVSLQKGEPVEIVGFGKFYIRERAARKGRNPMTGAELTIKAARLPVFKAGKALKDAVESDSGKDKSNKRRTETEEV